jgi:hypothetical protein
MGRVAYVKLVGTSLFPLAQIFLVKHCTVLFPLFAIGSVLQLQAAAINNRIGAGKQCKEL